MVFVHKKEQRVHRRGDLCALCGQLALYVRIGLVGPGLLFVSGERFLLLLRVISLPGPLEKASRQRLDNGIASADVVEHVLGWPVACRLLSFVVVWGMGGSCRDCETHPTGRAKARMGGKRLLAGWAF